MGKRDCFTCKNNLGCPHTWICYDYPETFECNYSGIYTYEPIKEIITYDCNKPDEEFKNNKKI